MNTLKNILLVFFLISNIQALAQLPELYLVNAAKVDAVKKNALSDKATSENIKKLTKGAEKLLDKEFGTVMDKKKLPPCGNMHEYFSLAKYFWPNPAKPDGLPYIRKDGQKNPETALVSDDKNFDDMLSAVNTLSWAYYFTEEEKYATKCIGLMRLWFLDTATYMIPSLNHAQVRMGKDTGSKSGIIDTHELPQLIDAMALLRTSKQWQVSDELGMKQWFAAYLKWLLTSKNGIDEGKARNNHGTFYDVQIVTIAAYCGEKKIADDMLQAGFERLGYQIEPDGKQPLELERTLALSYSIFNLEAWSLLATVAEKQGVDFWNYQTADGRSIKKAIDYLVPYIIDGKKWEYEQIGSYKEHEFYRLLLIAADKFKDKTYLKHAAKIKESNKNVFTRLFYE